MLRNVILLTVVTALSCAASGRAEGPAEIEARTPLSLEDFVILEYVAAGAYAPGALIAMDNNARILFACREGCSGETLRSSGIGFSDSQLEFLVATNLLVRDVHGDLYTTFPVLEVESTEMLRAEAAKLADTLSVALEPQAAGLARALEAAGHGSRAYSVLFSYVLDGMAWGFFEEYRRVFPRVLSARRPFWVGEVWALRPGRSSRPATRSLTSGGVTLKTTSRAQSEVSGGLFADPRRLKRAVAAFSAPGLPVPEEERALLSEFGLVNENGRWAIPVIDEVEKDAIFRAAETLTSDLVDEVLARVDVDSLQERFRFSTPQQALVILYHEVMWELIDRFEAMGLVKRPESLRTPEAESRDERVLADTAFLVDRRRSKPERQDVVEPKRDSVEEPEGGGA